MLLPIRMPNCVATEIRPSLLHPMLVRDRAYSCAADV